MGWKVELSAVFQKQILGLDKKLRKMIFRKMLILREHPTFGKAMTADLKGYFVLKVSKYRVFYRLANESHIVKVDAVELREKGYDRFERSHL